MNLILIGRFALKGVVINTSENLKHRGSFRLCRSLGIGGVAETHAPPHTCYHVKFGSSTTQSERINGREPPKQRSAVARPTVVGRLLIPQNKPPPRLCYHVRFGTSATKSAYALIEGNPHNGERCDLAHLGVGHVADRLKQALSQMCYRVKFDCWFCMRQMVDA